MAVWRKEKVSSSSFPRKRWEVVVPTFPNVEEHRRWNELEDGFLPQVTLSLNLEAFFPLIPWNSLNATPKHSVSWKHWNVFQIQKYVHHSCFFSRLQDKNFISLDSKKSSWQPPSPHYRRRPAVYFLTVRRRGCILE